MPYRDMSQDGSDGYAFDPQQRNRNTGITGDWRDAEPGGITGGPFGHPGSAQAPTPAPPPWIQNDYWAPDRNQVLADPSRWGPGPNGQPPPQQPQTPSPFDRTAFRDSWIGTGNNVSAQDALLNQYGINLSGNGTGTLPSGEIMDLRRGARAGDNTAQWMGVGEVHNGQPTYYGQNPSGGGGGQLDSAFRDALLKAMTGANAPYDPNAPQNAGQQTAFNVQRDRAAQQSRAALAERAAANGMNAGGAGSGAFDSGVQGILENAGQDKSSFAGGLAQQDYQAKRQDLSHALDLANAVGARQEANALQMQLAQLDNQYRYTALNQQQSQFEDTQAYNWTNWLTNQNRTNLLDGMGG